MPLRYIIYCRKSTESEDRQILSLPAQKRELREYAKKNNLKIVDTLTESASAYKLGRLKFNELLRRIQDGEADAILVWAYNRLARNALDGGMIVHLLDQGIIKEIRTPSGFTDGGGNSKFMLQLEFAMSKKSSDDNSESVKRGNREKILRGWDIRSHAGYKFEENVQTGELVLVKDPIRYDLIRKAIYLVLHKKPVSEALTMLNDTWGYRTHKTRRQGDKPMSLSNLYKLLHDDFYCGWIYTPDDERIRGKHEPMISEAEFWEIQAVLGAKGKPRPKYLVLPYRGLVQCGECGCSVCLEEKHQCICSQCKTKFSSKNRDACPHCNTSIDLMENPKLLHYVYARCSKKRPRLKCAQKAVRLESLDNQLIQYLSSLELSPRVIEWVLKQLAEKHKSEFQTQEQIHKNLAANLEKVQVNLRSLLSRFTSPENVNFELIEADEYKELKQKLQVDKAAIEEKIADANAHEDIWMKTAEDKFDFARTACKEFEAGDYLRRTDIIRDLGSNLILKDGKILIDQEHAWLFIRKANQKLAELKTQGLEPEKSLDLYEQT